MLDIMLTLFLLYSIRRNDEETNSKGEGEEHDDSHRSPKDGEDRPSSSGEYSYFNGSFHNLVLFKTQHSQESTTRNQLQLLPLKSIQISLGHQCRT